MKEFNPEPTRENIRLMIVFLTQELKRDKQRTIELLLKDYDASGIKGQAKFMELNHNSTTQPDNKPLKRRSESRQKRHQSNS